MPDTSFRQKVDNFLTNYLRNTTTDQEILNYYGEGNIIGRKGIPNDVRSVLTSVEKAAINPLFRPDSGKPNIDIDGPEGMLSYTYSTKDMPGVVNPASGRPWQMTFGSLPKDFGERSLTPAARQYLSDFRVPKNAGKDYSFATGPNIQDRKDIETTHLKENDPYWGRSPERLQEKINEIQNQSERIGNFSGQPQTPETWKQHGYITEKPENFKSNVLDEFKNKILADQGSFGGVSTLTPVQGRGDNPDWRAHLYEKTGLAGPLSEQPSRSWTGAASTQEVQQFTPGKERLFPLQPYSEFLQGVSGTTKPSILGTKPALDFTPFQKAVGTRNYLIGQNILAGRGSLGAPVRVVQATPAALRSSVRPATKGLLLDAGINYALGASPQEALVTAGTDLISAEGLGGAPTAAIERRGPRGEFVDTRSNTVLAPSGRYTDKGIAIKRGKPIIVPRGSVAGEGNLLTQTQDVLKNAAAVWRKRLGALGMFGR